MNRECTQEWKVAPIRQAIKKLYPKNNFKNPVTMWLGISTDEAQRMKESWVKYVKHQYPLITLELSRFDCQQILKEYNWEAVKSSCYMCPFQVKRWLENKEIDKAIEFEERLQKENKTYKQTPYLHPSGLSLREVIERDKKQFSLFENWDFLNECEGHCGV
jgi:3'-phosphoadenosine 5'-phosphosulfate sulfotransferase (PAPS reductase)/FAD synthetase